MHYVSEVYNT